MAKYKLSDIAPIRQGAVPDEFPCWLLNLDMVESNTGRIIKYLYVQSDEIGASTVAFDTSNVLYSKLRPYLNKVVLPDRPGFATSEMLPLMPNTAIITREYLTYFLRSPRFVGYINEKTSGAKMPRANTADLKTAEIDCPSIEQQTSIVGMLERVTHIIELRQRQLRAFDTLIKARFIEMFGDQEQFESAPLDNSVEEMFIGPFGSSLKNECFVPPDQGFCIVYEQKHAIRKTMDVETRYVDEHKYKELQRFTVRGGDIIVSCRGTIGETFIVPDDAPMGIMHPSIMKIRLKSERYDRVFFDHLLQSILKQHEAEANGSGVKMAITATALGQEMFIIPPLSVQRQFAAFVSQVDKSKVVIQAALDKAQTLFDSLMQKYFG